MTIAEHIVAFIRENQGLACHRQLVEACHVERQQVDYAIRGLLASGIVRREQSIYQLSIEPVVIQEVPKARRCSRCENMTNEFYGRDGYCRPCRKIVNKSRYLLHCRVELPQENR